MRWGKAPPSTIAPPGPYYLFVNKASSKGPIPSVARVVTVGGKTNGLEAIEPMQPQMSMSAAKKGSAGPAGPPS